MISRLTLWDTIGGSRPLDVPSSGHLKPLGAAPGLFFYVGGEGGASSKPEGRPVACLRPPTTARASSYQPECQFDQSYNDDCAEDNELSENKRWLVGRANFDYYAPRAHRKVNDVLSTNYALARWRPGVLLRCGGQIAVSHDGPPRIEISHEQMKASAGHAGNV